MRTTFCFRVIQILALKLNNVLFSFLLSELFSVKMSVHRGAFPSCRNFLIPKEFQSCIIGKEGKTIQGIQITTGTHIKIKDNKDPQKCMVSITGRANSTRAAEKKIRQVIDEHTKSAKRQQETKEINDWKKSLGFNSGDGILLKVCSEFKNGKCNLTEVSPSRVFFSYL